MNTRDHLIKSIIFRPELIPFVKDEDNSLSFLEEFEIGEFIEDSQSDADEESPSLFLEADTGNCPEPGLLDVSEWKRTLRRRSMSIAA